MVMTNTIECHMSAVITSFDSLIVLLGECYCLPYYKLENWDPDNLTNVPNTVKPYAKINYFKY